MADGAAEILGQGGNLLRDLRGAFSGCIDFDGMQPLIQGEALYAPLHYVGRADACRHVLLQTPDRTSVRQRKDKTHKIKTLGGWIDRNPTKSSAAA